MRRDVRALGRRTFDLLVLGGGIVGASTALHAAQWGQHVALVEARDFGAGTSGATTRLAHGGLRYLEQYDFPQVREGLRERGWLLRAAPHLVQPLPFLFPLLPEQRRFGQKLGAALAVYDLLAGRFPRGHRRSAEAARREEPSLRPGLAAAAAFEDALILHPERLVLEFAMLAEEFGAEVANHAEVEALAAEGRGWRATVRDTLTDQATEVRARTVVNCAGPWVERVLRRAGHDVRLARTTRGTHVALSQPLRRALVLRARDGRTFFAVPWQEVTLVGTTDLDEAGDPGDVVATSEEVRYLLEEAANFVDLPGEPCYTTVGVRSLLRVGGVAPGRIPRGHEVVRVDDGEAACFNVVGGKLTTGRVVGRDAAAEATAWLGDEAAPAPFALPGAARLRPPSTLLERSVHLFGAFASEVGGQAVCPQHVTEGMVRRAVRAEQCATLPDFLLRRTLAGHAPDLAAHCVDAVAKALGAEAGWDARQREEQREAWAQWAERRRAGLGP